MGSAAPFRRLCEFTLFLVLVQVCTGAATEMITPGGEIAFVLQMLRESAREDVRGRCRYVRCRPFMPPLSPHGPPGGSRQCSAGSAPSAQSSTSSAAATCVPPPHRTAPPCPDAVPRSTTTHSRSSSRVRPAAGPSAGPLATSASPTYVPRSLPCPPPADRPRHRRSRARNAPPSPRTSPRPRRSATRSPRPRAQPSHTSLRASRASSCARTLPGSTCTPRRTRGRARRGARACGRSPLCPRLPATRCIAASRRCRGRRGWCRRSGCADGAARCLRDFGAMCAAELARSWRRRRGDEGHDCVYSGCRDGIWGNCARVPRGWPGARGGGRGDGVWEIRGAITSTAGAEIASGGSARVCHGDRRGDGVWEMWGTITSTTGAEMASRARRHFATSTAGGCRGEDMARTYYTRRTLHLQDVTLQM